MALDERAKYGVIAVCFTLAIVIALVNISGGGEYKSRDVDRIWMKDLTSGQLFDVGVMEGVHPPIQAPSGGEAVRAHVFACGDCGEDNQRFIAYLEQYLPEAHKMFASGGHDQSILARTHVIREEDQTEWVPIGSPEGVVIVNRKNSKCKDLKLVPCFPK